MHFTHIQLGCEMATPNHSTWNKNDNVYSESSNNFYYDDSGDGGYNHLEIRRVKRLYTQGAKKKGASVSQLLQFR